jgi:ADP-ribosylglycohydrolase
MLGAIIGDIVGSVYEYDNIKTKDFEFLTGKSFFTDDTIMTIAVADALLNGGTADNFIDSMKKFGRLYPKADYGSNFGAWLMSNDRKPYNSWGNGSAMRVSPCAWFAKSLEEAEDLAERSAAVTHNHPEGIKGAKAVAAAIYLLRTRHERETEWEPSKPIPTINSDDDLLKYLEAERIIESVMSEEELKRKKADQQAEIAAFVGSLDKKHTDAMAEIKEYIESKYGYNLSRKLDDIRPNYRFDESCQGTVPEAIIAFLESDSFVDAIRNAISLGGDSDTLAAITGSIAEAYYGIPKWIINVTIKKLDDTLAKVINAWHDSGVSVISVAKKGNREIEGEFSKSSKIKEKFELSEKHLALIRYGLRPREMEDKWFIYYEDGRLFFHRSWTGKKIFEAQIKKCKSGYAITEILVESDKEIYKATKERSLSTFYFLIARGLFGINVEVPKDSDDPNALLKAWTEFGRMSL